MRIFFYVLIIYIYLSKKYYKGVIIMQIEVKNLTKQFKTKGKRTKLLFHKKEIFEI